MPVHFLPWYCFGYFLKLLKEGLQRFTYPPETEDDNETEVSFPPIEVTVEVHKNVVFFEDPEVARWDAEGMVMP